MTEYLPLLTGKKVAIVVNQTSVIDNTHLLDTLLSLNIQVKIVFVPEHGFRGMVSAGARVADRVDEKTGTPIISLYGSNKKPKESDLEGIEVVIFDIQDVGVRFYTYSSTLHYVMEACAENHIPLIVLDRPNPNGFYVDGPVLKREFRSFVGMHPVPIVHGLTLGEYATMINEEKWLDNGIVCDLKVVRMAGYDHNSLYVLPINPSPNLRNMLAIYLYPSLCLFEGTIMSVGRGTEKPFQVFGHPRNYKGKDCFVPVSRPGAMYPLYIGEVCCGMDLSTTNISVLTSRKALNLEWIIDTYWAYPNKDEFFNDYFNKLAGNEILKKQIMGAISEEDIRRSWARGLDEYMKMRSKYLLYDDFE